ncbi:MAG: histidine phosphatase family protein [Clostridia bacterium]|nr:histidine phosphatase family protein [Clostridia bacterium]
MTEIYLIRHGESESNKIDTFAGMTDFALSEKGRVQVAKTAERLKNYGIQAIYSSPLKRAHETAEALSEATGLPVTDVFELHEVCCGVWEGLPFSEVEKRYPEDLYNWTNCLGDFRPTGGESKNEVRARMKAAMTKIAEENDGKIIAVASHASAIRGFVSEILGLEYGELPYQSNAAFCHLFYENGKFTVEKYNINDHLEGLVTVPAY